MAQLTPINLVAPGAYGLNKEAEQTLLPPQWATEAQNCVIKQGNRIGNREGWADQTTNAVAANAPIDVIHEYIQENGTKVVICTAGNAIYKDIDDFTDTTNDITSSTAPTADHWQFVNFNDYVIGVQRGHAPIQWQNSGDFTDIVFTGTGYDGNCICAAFGRVWAADADLQTVRYSSLLDHTDMSTSGGTIDMSSVWTQGMDEIVAIEAIGSNLVVFGRNHIVIWADGTGSEIGLNPNNIYVVDTIEGTGCIARDSIARIGEGDLWFLSRHGIQSLGRVIADKNNPLTSITDNIKTYFKTLIATEIASDTNLDAVRAVHSPEEGFYLLNLPVNDLQICIDDTAFDDNGKPGYAITDWILGGSIKALCVRQNGDLLFGSSGVVGKYSGDDDNGSAYTFSFYTAWLDLGELNGYLKMLKEVGNIVQVGASTTVVWRWQWDFVGTTYTKQVTYDSSTSSEWNIAEFSIGEFSGSTNQANKTLPGRGQGKYIRVGATCSINGSNITIQQITLLPKVGRLAA